jgi:biopolymer transport protein TolR
MAVGVASAASSGKRRRRGQRAIMSEINVTPFVDVMLVLLIVFMVSAPLLSVGVPVHLPQSKARTVSQSLDLLTVSVDEKGQIYLQNDQVSGDELLQKLQAVAKAKGGLRAPIYFKGDLDMKYSQGDVQLRYNTVMHVLGLLNGAGYSDVVLVTDFDNSPDKGHGR